MAGELLSLGGRIDVAEAIWTNIIPANELIAVREDPDFDPSQSALSHGRPIEIQTLRWTTCDTRRFGCEALPGARMTITERAYTTPIWCSPRKK